MPSQPNDLAHRRYDVMLVRSDRGRTAVRAMQKTEHPHRFRDIFAVELLNKDVSIEGVSRLLSHTSIHVTERHYSPWVKSRQERLDAVVDRA